MKDVFISHVEEDRGMALEVADGSQSGDKQLDQLRRLVWLADPYKRSYGGIPLCPDGHPSHGAVSK